MSMRDHQPHADHKVTLLGGGPVDAAALQRCLSLAPRLVAADGGADYAHAHGHTVTHIIGDLDSLSTRTTWQNSGTPITTLTEQDTTDFEKCLYTENASIFLGIGFVGGLLDHTLACLRSLCVYKDVPIVLIGEDQIIMHAGRKFATELNAGDRVSLFPLAPVRGLESTGLRWPIAGLDFSPTGQIGTSNSATGGPVEMSFDRDGMLIFLPLDALESVVHRLSR